MVKLEEKTAPTYTDLISLATAKEFLRVTHSSEDTLITSLISAGIESAQNFTNTRFLWREYTLYMSAWNDVYSPNSYSGYLYRDIATNSNAEGGYYSPFTGLPQIVLPSPPLKEVSRLEYYDTTNTKITYHHSNYTLNKYTNQKNFIEINKDVTLPEVYDRADAIQISFTAGMGSAGADVPDAIKQAILLIVGHLYEKREDTVSRLPKASEYLLEPYRIKTY